MGRGLRRFLPLLNRARRSVGKRLPLETAARTATVLQPEEREEIRPPVFLQGQLEKVTAGVSGHGTLAGELALATQRSLVHSPVIRFELKDCLVHPGGVDFQGGAVRKQPLGIRPLASGRIETRSRAIYCMSAVSHQYFGHWLQDACATALLAEPDESLLLDVRADWPHAGQYATAFGLSPDPAPLVFVESLTLCQDHGQGANKRARYADLRRRLAAAVDGPCADGGRVYFRRGAGGVARLVANEDEVTRALDDLGFEVFDLEGASMADIQRRFRSARTVVSVDGSHLNHLYYALPPDSLLLTLVPADRFTLNQIAYCAAISLRYAFMVVDPRPEGYFVSIGDLLDTLERAGA